MDHPSFKVWRGVSGIMDEEKMERAIVKHRRVKSSRHQIIVVPPDEGNLPVEPVEIIFRGFRVFSVAKVAEEKHFVLKGNGEVPVVDEDRVHLANIGKRERPAAVPYDVGMTAVEVRHDEDVSGFISGYVTALKTRLPAEFPERVLP